MPRIIYALAVAVLGAMALSAAQAQPSDRYGQQKVVYHINYDGGEDSAAYRAAMNNIQNHINAVGAENLDVKVVMHGDGLGLLMSAKGDDRLMTQVAGLKGQNVDFAVCQNTLTGRDIAVDDLYDVWDQDIVPSGVAELSRLQQQGYTYIKP